VLALVVTLLSSATTLVAQVGSITLVGVEAPNEGNWPATDHTGESWGQFRGNFLESIGDDVEGFAAYGDPFAADGEGRGVYIPVPNRGLSVHESIVTTPDFHSWKGKVVTTDGGAYSTSDFVEYGGRIHFSNEIEAPAGMYFMLKDVKYHFRSPDEYYNEFIDFPMVFNSTRIGTAIGGAQVYDDPGQQGFEFKKLQNLRYIGIGIGLGAFGEGSNQQKIQNTLGYLRQSGFTITCTVTVKWYRISDNSPAGEKSESLTISFGDCASQDQIERALTSIRFNKVGQDAHLTFQSLNGVYFRPIRTVDMPTLEQFRTWYSIPELSGVRIRPHSSASIVWQGGATGRERYYGVQAVSICRPWQISTSGRVVRDNDSAEKLVVVEEETPSSIEVLVPEDEVVGKVRVVRDYVPAYSGPKPPKNIFVP